MFSARRRRTPCRIDGRSGGASRSDRAVKTGGDESERGPHAAGDPLPQDCALIEVRVAELQQLFNLMDASPFRERDLDPDAEEFIVGWAREVPSGARLALLVVLNRAPGLTDEPTVLRDAVLGFFKHRARASRTRLHQLFVVGRISLLVGLCFLVAAVGLGGLVAGSMPWQRIGEFIQQGLVICGWVAMWRPLEIFLYGWWPIRSEARLFDRLGEMPVRIAYAGTAEPDAWRRDWPALPRGKATAAETPRQVSSPHAGEAPPAADSVVPLRGPVAASVAPQPTPRGRSDPT